MDPVLIVSSASLLPLATLALTIDDVEYSGNAVSIFVTNKVSQPSFLKYMVSEFVVKAIAESKSRHVSEAAICGVPIIVNTASTVSIGATGSLELIIISMG